MSSEQEKPYFAAKDIHRNGNAKSSCQKWLEKTANIRNDAREKVFLRSRQTEREFSRFFHSNLPKEKRGWISEQKIIRKFGEWNHTHENGSEGPSSWAWERSTDFPRKKEETRVWIRRAWFVFTKDILQNWSCKELAQKWLEKSRLRISTRVIYERKKKDRRATALSETNSHQEHRKGFAAKDTHQNDPGKPHLQKWLSKFGTKKQIIWMDFWTRVLAICVIGLFTLKQICLFRDVMEVLVVFSHISKFANRNFLPNRTVNGKSPPTRKRSEERREKCSKIVQTWLCPIVWVFSLSFSEVWLFKIWKPCCVEPHNDASNLYTHRNVTHHVSPSGCPVHSVSHANIEFRFEIWLCNLNFFEKRWRGRAPPAPPSLFRAPPAPVSLFPRPSPLSHLF